MKKIYLLLLLGIIFISNPILSQTESNNKFYFDFISGPYLFVDHIPYDAVLMSGARLGKSFDSRFNVNLEYVVGQQQDKQHTLGLTHNVNVQFNYKLNKTVKKFAPYFYVGSGFIEFKSFTKDVYGLQFNAGLGTELKIFDQLFGLIETRYFNLAQLKLEGQHELAVFWGVRLKF